MKNLLFIGDVVGKSGCDFLASRIYSMKKKYSVDITVINGENSAQGNGITAYSAGLIKNNCGADVITTGNHCYKRRDSLAIYDEEYIIRPANYPEGCAGRGLCIIDMGSYKAAVVNLMGTVYMEPLDNPFTVAENILKDIKKNRVFLYLDTSQNAIGTVTVKGNEICRLFVLPAYQGKGFGTEMPAFVLILYQLFEVLRYHSLQQLLGSEGTPCSKLTYTFYH